MTQVFRQIRGFVRPAPDSRITDLEMLIKLMFTLPIANQLCKTCLFIAVGRGIGIAFFPMVEM